MKKAVIALLLVAVAATAFIVWSGSTEGDMAALGGGVCLKQDGETIPLRVTSPLRFLPGFYLSGTWKIHVYDAVTNQGISASVMFLGWSTAHSIGTDSSGYLEHYTGWGVLEIRVSKTGYIGESRSNPSSLTQTFYLQPEVSETFELRNIPSQRVLEKAGFTKEGVIRKATFIRGAWRDGVLYSILREEWKEPKIFTKA